MWRAEWHKAKVKLNDQVIPAGQAAYSFSDTTAEPGNTYDYTVEFLSSVGLNQNFHLRVEVPGQGDDDTAIDDTADDDTVTAKSGDDDDSGGKCGC